MSSSGAWVNLITAVSAAGVTAVVAKLFSEGAQEAVQRIRRATVRKGNTNTQRAESSSRGDARCRHRAPRWRRKNNRRELDAEVFLRKYVESQEESAHTEVERD
jgi:hypothetical protein